MFLSVREIYILGVVWEKMVLVIKYNHRYLNKN